MIRSAVPFRRGRAWLAISCLLACGALLAACGSSSSKSSSSAGSSASAASGGGSGSSSSSSSSGKHVTIGVVETFTSIPFYQTARLGALAAGTEDGNATVIVQGPAESTGSGEATMASNLETAKQPDGFAPNPCVLPAWTQTLATLARDVPNNNVAAWNCKPIGEAGQTSPVKTYVGVNDFETGEQQAEVAIKGANLGASTTGTALVAYCEKGVPILTSREEGALAEIKKLTPKVQGVGFFSALDQNGNTAAWTSEFTKYPHVVLAMGACDQDSASLITLKSRGVGGDFASAAVDPDPQELQAIESGKMTAAVASAPWVQANVAVQLLIKGARGTALPQGWVDTGIESISKANAPQWLKAASSPAAAQAFFAPIANKIVANPSAVLKPMSAAAGSTS
jgi:ABC-type sugar transport system substrate-binding protein